MHSLRHGVKYALKRTHLLPAARVLQYWGNFLTDPLFRSQEQERRRRKRTLEREFSQFKQQYGNALRHRLNGAEHKQQKRALVVGIGFVGGVRPELGLIKGLELAGFTPVILTGRDPWLVKYYELAGVTEILFWDEFMPPVDPAAGEAVVAGLQSFEDLLAFEYMGARVGRFAASTSLRHLRVGSLDLRSSQIREHLAHRLVDGIRYAAAAREIIHQVRPQIALFVDRGYTPQGELFDICLAEGVQAITWNAAHKSNTLILKRYTLENRDEHPASLSAESWRYLRSIVWTDTHRQCLKQELHHSYVSGDWYSEVGTQFNKQVITAAEIRQQLGLDPDKKTAIIFSHILWDGTFFWGEDLFRNYEAWFVETVRVACTNVHVNWVIKIHPANIVKNVRDGVQGESSEIIAIREYIGQLPPHIFIIPADSDISTFALFELMDYCVTVRGTIGIEAASFGIPVLTAGTGRYDHKGFTIDSESRQEYLKRIKHIQDIPSLSPVQHELAERFAYGIFILRPLPLTTITLEYQQDAKATLKTHINATTREDWLNAPDLNVFAGWAADPDQADLLMPLPVEADSD